MKTHLVALLSIAFMTSSSLAAPPDFCSSVDGINQITQFITCQQDISMVACGALGTYAAGRAVAQRMRKQQQEMVALALEKDSEKMSRLLFKEYVDSRGVFNTTSPKSHAREDLQYHLRGFDVRQQVTPIVDESVNPPRIRLAPGAGEAMKAIGLNPESVDDIRKLEEWVGHYELKSIPQFVNGQEITKTTFDRLPQELKDQYKAIAREFLEINSTLEHEWDATKSPRLWQMVDRFDAKIKANNLISELFEPKLFLSVGRNPQKPQLASTYRKFLERTYGVELPVAPGKAVLIKGLGAVAGAALFVNDSTVGACDEYYMQHIHMRSSENRCEPVYEVDGNVINFITGNPDKVRNALKDPRVCDFYRKLYDKLFVIPEFSDITCQTADQISVRLSSRGKVYDQTIRVSNGLVRKITMTSDRTTYEIDVNPTDQSVTTIKQALGPQKDTFTIKDANSLGNVPSALLDQLKQMKLYTQDIVNCCAYHNSTCKTDFVKGLKSTADVKHAQ